MTDISEHVKARVFFKQHEKVINLFKLLNKLDAIVSFCSKELLHFLNFFTLIKILKLQHVSVLMDHPQGVRRT